MVGLRVVDAEQEQQAYQAKVKRLQALQSGNDFQEVDGINRTCRSSVLAQNHRMSKHLQDRQPALALIQTEASFATHKARLLP